MKYNQTAYLILGILSFHPRQSGYHIRKTVETTVGFFWGESYGQIYPTLKRLLSEGLISADPAPATSKKPSQEYTITEAGHGCLEEWLAVPYRADPPRDEFLLKLFFGVEAPSAISVAHITRFQQENRALLATLTQLEAVAKLQDNGTHPGFPFWMLTLDFGLHQLRSALVWSEAALAKLAALEAKNLVRNPLAS
jgi:DNA-binding PadR family transcriptional regulator